MTLAPKKKKTRKEILAALLEVEHTLQAVKAMTYNDRDPDRIAQIRLSLDQGVEICQSIRFPENP
jgi:hypothetical protein